MTYKLIEESTHVVIGEWTNNLDDTNWDRLGNGTLNDCEDILTNVKNGSPWAPEYTHRERIITIDKYNKMLKDDENNVTYIF